MSHYEGGNPTTIPSLPATAKAPARLGTNKNNRQKNVYLWGMNRKENFEDLATAQVSRAQSRRIRLEPDGEIDYSNSINTDNSNYTNHNEYVGAPNNLYINTASGYTSQNTGLYLHNTDPTESMEMSERGGDDSWTVSAAKASLSFIATDAMILDPSDAAVYKWVGYGIVSAVAGAVLYYNGTSYPKPWYTDRPNNYIPRPLNKPNNKNYFPQGNGNDFIKWIIRLGGVSVLGKKLYDGFYLQPNFMPADNTTFINPLPPPLTPFYTPIPNPNRP